MAAWGASDSVIMQTPVSLKSCGSLFFFSRLLSAGRSAQQTHAFILSTIPHTLLDLSYQRAAAEWTLAHPALWEWKEVEAEKPTGISLSISVDDDQLAEQERGNLSYPWIMHSYISPIYLYLHTLLFCSERRKDNSAKICTCGGLIATALFPFAALYGVCQTQWT